MNTWLAILDIATRIFAIVLYLFGTAIFAVLLWFLL